MISKRRFRATIALTLGLATPRLSSADNWTNPAGGGWNINSNWGNGLPPGYFAPGTQQVDNYGVFNLNSSTGYTVTGAVGNIILQNDNVTFTDNPTNQQMGNSILVNASAGQISSLTMANGAYTVYAGNFTSQGTAGNANINFDTYSYDTSRGIGFDGSGSMTTNVNISRSTIEGDQGISFEGGTTNINMSNSQLITDNAVEFGRTGTITATLNQVSVSAHSTFIVGSGTANSTVGLTDSTAFATQLILGAANLFNPSMFNYPVIGGGNGVMTLNNTSFQSSDSSIIGTSSGNGLLNVLNGSNFNSPSFVLVGDLGTGRINVSGGTMESGFAYIGANNGNGSVTLHGSTSVWSLSGICSIGSFNGANGDGLVELDHQATFNLGGGAVNISPTGALDILSGSRVDAGKLNESSGSTISLGLDGPTASQNGQLDLSGVATLAGTLNVILENGFTPAVGEQFQLFDWAGETGTFSAVNLPPAYTWDTSELYSQGIVAVTGSVPEPTSLGFLLLGAGLLGRPRKRTSALPFVAA